MHKAIYYINQDSEVVSNIPEQAIAIPVNGTLDKAMILTSLAKACDFPSYFSHNWDSAWDCLTDSDVVYLKLDLADVETIDTEDLNIFKSMIEDAYRDLGKPQLWIIGCNDLVV